MKFADGTIYKKGYEKGQLAESEDMTLFWNVFLQGQVTSLCNSVLRL